MTQVAVVYYSSTGTNHAMAQAVAEGAGEAGADVRLRIAPETVPYDVLSSNPAWKAFVDDVRPGLTEVSAEDLTSSDGIAFGTPTRYGAIAAQLKAFIDSLGPQWMRGELADKAYTAFTSAINDHGGNEGTIHSVYNVVMHFGGIVVPPGYTDEAVYAAGGNPYGTSWGTGTDGDPVPETVLAAARYQGRRLATFAARLAG
jgi:NAD(P)H dehydrogenase (quinone)